MLDSGRDRLSRFGQREAGIGIDRYVGCRAALPSDEAVLDVPSVYALYRFAAKLRRFKALLDACLDRVLGQLRLENPNLSRYVAINGSDLPPT